MKKLIAAGSGARAFIAALGERTSQVQGRSENGHRIMNGWEFCPEEAIVNSLVSQGPAGPFTPMNLDVALYAALYVIEGRHAGEFFKLCGPVETVGCEADCTLVLTPPECSKSACNSASNSASKSQRCKLLLPDSVNDANPIRVVSEQGSPVRVNGAETESSFLYDYDEIEILGNRMLVLVNPQPGTAGPDRVKRGWL